MNVILKKAVLEWLTKKTNHALSVMMNNGVNIRDGIVLKDGVPVYKIKRRYSTKKVNGCYRELTPALETI